MPLSSYRSKTVLAHLTAVTLTFDPVIPKSIGFLCYQGQMCKPSLWKVGQSSSRVIDRKQKGYRWTNRHVQSNMPSLLRGGIQTAVDITLSKSKLTQDEQTHLMTNTVGTDSVYVRIPRQLLLLTALATESHKSTFHIYSKYQAQLMTNTE